MMSLELKTKEKRIKIGNLVKRMNIHSHHRKVHQVSLIIKQKTVVIQVNQRKKEKKMAKNQVMVINQEMPKPKEKIGCHQN